MNEWVDAICAHLNLRDQSDVSNAYTISPIPNPTVTSSSHYGTMPTLSPTTSSLYSSGSAVSIPGRNVSPVFYPSQYGTLSTVHMGPGMSTYGSSPTGRGPPPSPPPPYSGVCIIILSIVITIYGN